MKIEIKPQFEKLIRDKIEAGLYSAPEEVVEDALTLMKERGRIDALKLQRLREAIEEGEADLRAGRYTVLETEADLDAFFAKL